MVTSWVGHALKSHGENQCNPRYLQQPDEYRTKERHIQIARCESSGFSMLIECATRRINYRASSLWHTLNLRQIVCVASMLKDVIH
jgi:hypothetical protein